MRPRASLLRFLPSTKCQETQTTPCKLVHQQLLLLQKHSSGPEQEEGLPTLWLTQIVSMTQRAGVRNIPQRVLAFRQSKGKGGALSGAGKCR